MGAGGTLRWMENAGLRARMDSVIEIIDQCKEPDGYLMAYPKRAIFDFENGAYVRSWITHGLIEAGYAGNPKAFPAGDAAQAGARCARSYPAHTNLLLTSRQT